MTVKRSIKRSWAYRNVKDSPKNLVIVLLFVVIVYLYYRNTQWHVDYVAVGEKGSFFEGLNKNPDGFRIDWHDYKLMDYERRRKGPGEQGVAATVAASSERQRKLYAANGYDGYLSDLISVNRSVRDVRPFGCRSRKYLANLPTVSAIIPVFNEHFSIVMRTAHSIMNRAQGDLVREVIFVNDKSDPQFLNATFDDYVSRNFNGRARVIHLEQRVGLIQARMAGARVASSDVLLFADAHTEATINYLPPLLDPIAQNYRVCTVPIEDGLDVHSFEYTEPEPHTRVIFDWWMNERRVPVQSDDPSERYKTPIMKGGLFAISAKFFWELDGYDDQLEIWGGEQYEISFKIWMCGGEMYMVPCSHFGHMFRSDSRPFVNPRPYDYITRNYKRVIEVWMDEYKQAVYQRDPDGWQIDAGPLLRQHALRAKLQCRSFKWYLDNVAPEILEKYPAEGRPWFAKGAIRSVGSKTLCLDSMNEEDKLGLSSCHTNRTHPDPAQNFELSYFRDIVQYGSLQFECLHVEANQVGQVVYRSPCTQTQGQQFWHYDRVTKLLIHDLKRNHCLEADMGRLKAVLKGCNRTNLMQQWEWGRLNTTMLDHWRTMGAKLEIE